MLLSDAFKVREKVQFGNLNDTRDFIEVDASLSEVHNRTITVSDNEVEDGSKISDHTNKQPDRVNLEVEISEIPLSTLPSLTGVAQGAAFSKIRQSLGGLGGLAVAEGKGYISNQILKEKSNRMINNLTQLERYMDESILMFLTTDIRRYESMIIDNVSIPRNVELGDSLKLNISFRSIKIVSSETVLVPEVKTKNVASAASEQNSGKQKTKEPTEGQEERGSSALFKIGKGFGILGGN